MTGKKKRILVCCDTLVIGGAETFAMRMARYYKERGHDVRLAAIFGEKINRELVKENAGDIPIIALHIPPLLNWLLYKFDGLLVRLGIYYEFRRFLAIRKYRKLLEREPVDFVHTNMFGTLDVFNHAAKNLPEVTLAHSVHADIIDLAYREVSGNTKVLAKYDYHCLKVRTPEILKRINYVVCTAQMQVNIFNAWDRMQKEKLVKIYNPVDVKTNINETFSRADMGIPDDAFVYGSMLRCIPEKGWGELILAFIQAAIPNSFLVLIGGGPYLAELKKQYGAHKNIIFLDNQPAPVKYLKLIDVGVSPSWFWESLPTAIIDYLGLGKPVIVTDNAESRYMIQSPNGPAGLVVPLRKDKWDTVLKPNALKVEDLTTALKEMYENKAQRLEFIQNTAGCFAMFDKEKIVSAYEKLFLQPQDKLVIPEQMTTV